MSLVVDTTIGLLFTYYLLRLSNIVLSKKLTQRLKSGNYFRGVLRNHVLTYHIDYQAWAQQLVVWLMIVIIVPSPNRGQILDRHPSDCLPGPSRRPRRLRHENVPSAHLRFGDLKSLKLLSVMIFFPTVLNIVLVCNVDPVPRAGHLPQEVRLQTDQPRAAAQVLPEL